jgi:hypothetical protein
MKSHIDELRHIVGCVQSLALYIIRSETVEGGLADVFLEESENEAYTISVTVLYTVHYVNGPQTSCFNT